MKPPTRLLDAANTELELRLLRAGAAEEPPTGALQRIADRLGVQAAEAATQAPAAAAAGGATFAATGGKLALVVTAGLAIAGVAWFATQPTEATKPGPAMTDRSAAAPAAAVERAASPPPSAVAAPAGAMPVPETPSAAQALSEEIARLDSVRRLLAARRATPALDALQSYERDYPNGALRQEAALLRIEATRRSGDRIRARALGERFLAENPDSPHAARVRALAFDRAHAR